MVNDKLSSTPEEISATETKDVKIREKVKAIETLPIGVLPKADLALVLLELKPATNLVINDRRVAPSQITEQLERLGLITAITKTKKIKRGNLVSIAVANDPEILEQLKQLDPEKDHEEFARLMGYPQTAIDAFLGRTEKLVQADKQWTKKDWLKFSETRKRFPFSCPVLSKDHTAEELALLEKWRTAVSEYAPDLISAWSKIRWSENPPTNVTFKNES